MARQLLSQRTGVAATAALLVAVAIGAWWLRYPPAVTFAAVEPIAVPAGPGARLPRLAAHPGGGAALSWVEPTPDGGHVLRVARYRDGRFEEPTEVARGGDWFVNWADFPSAVPIAPDFWLAHWLVVHPQADSPYHYGLTLALSQDDGHQWTPLPRPYPDVGPAEHGFAAIAGDGERASIVWIDGRARDARQTFTLNAADIGSDGTVGPDSVVDADACACCWPALARTTGNLWLAYRGRTADEIRDFQLRRRTADGWSTPIPLAGEGWQIAGCPVNGVSLAARGERLAASWFTAAGGTGRVRVAFIHDGADALDTVHDIDTANPVGRAGVAWLDDDTAAVVHIAAPAKGATVADLRLTPFTRAGVGRGHTIAELPTNRNSGVPQVLAVDGELLVAWTGGAPDQGIELRRIVRR